MYGKDYPFDTGDRHTFEWVLKNFKKLCDTFPDVAIKTDMRNISEAIEEIEEEQQGRYEDSWGVDF